jgi:hypothetical protein
MGFQLALLTKNVTKERVFVSVSGATATCYNSHVRLQAAARRIGKQRAFCADDRMFESYFN